MNQRPTSLTYGANMAVSSITYTAWGAISTMCGGQGCAQSQETRQYNNRLQPVLMDLGNSNNLSADYTLTCSYAGSASPACTIPQGAGDNGSITGETYTDHVNAGYSHTFTYCYDAVNRLTHAVASGSPAYDLMYSYDQYGNGTCVPGSGGGLCPAMSYNSSTNRLTSIGSTAVSYDAAGNQLNDIWSTYEYDAEGRVKHSYSSGQWQYPTYNALGQRVQDYQGTDPMTLTYPIDIFGQRTGAFAQWPSQNWTGWNVYWSQIAGQRLNMGGASAYIDHADAVGSTTMETDPAGAVQWDVTHYPWGGVFQEQGARQSEVVMGLDWQVNDPVIPSATRELSAALGRWMTPDPLGMAAVDPSNPQSWNMYAYALNNPTSNTDPSGLFIAGPGDDVTSVDLTSLGNVGVLTPQASEHGVPGGDDSTSSTSQTNTPKDSPCHGGQKGISPAEGKQVLEASQQFFGIPYNQQVCNVFVCNSINASNVLPGQKIYVTAKPSPVAISSSPYFAPVPASQKQSADVMVFSNPRPYHMGFYVPDPPTPNGIIDTFLSSTEHGNNGLGGPRYLPPSQGYFPGTKTYYRLQEPCHE